MARIWKLKRVGLWSVVKTGFVVSVATGALIGLFWGMMFALFASFLETATSSMRGPGFGPGAVLIMPVFSALFFGFFGAVTSFLAALIYNLAAGAFGGLELEIDTAEEPEQLTKTGNVTAPEAVYRRTRRVWRQPVASLVARRKRTASHRVEPEV
jgi:hypothetical protein